MIGNSKPSIALIGPGRLGQAVTALLRQQGYPITAIVGRDRQRTAEAAHFVGAELMATTDINRCTPADIILIATGDDQLAPIAAQLCATVALRDTTLLVHCSGLHPAKVLKLLAIWGGSHSSLKGNTRRATTRLPVWQRTLSPP
ncbi:MAG: hypothetical protein B6I37_06385 [Desulfobacteraceae bacterium 4572_35.2]|nr:MAG: hypothetical protein B6I37_06385 [Desulfobacteraceae bacterium 4572_35.2]